MQKVRKGEEVNALNLKQFLLEHQLIHDVNSELKIRQFTNGFSNLTYQLDIEDKVYVLRRPPVGAVKRGHDMGREYKVLSRLNQGFAKAPKVFAYTDNAEIIGASFYIMEKVEGIVLSASEAKQRQVSPSDFQIIAESWLDTFVDLYALDYKALGLADLGRPEGYVERQVTNWSKQYLKAKTEEIKDSTMLFSAHKNQKKTPKKVKRVQLMDVQLIGYEISLSLRIEKMSLQSAISKVKDLNYFWLIHESIYAYDVFSILQTPRV